jgi:hypothetical protein
MPKLNKCRFRKTFLGISGAFCLHPQHPPRHTKYYSVVTGRLPYCVGMVKCHDMEDLKGGK